MAEEPTKSKPTKPVATPRRRFGPYEEGSEVLFVQLKMLLNAKRRWDEPKIERWLEAFVAATRVVVEPNESPKKV